MVKIRFKVLHVKPSKKTKFTVLNNMFPYRSSIFSEISVNNFSGQARMLRRRSRTDSTLVNIVAPYPSYNFPHQPRYQDIACCVRCGEYRSQRHPLPAVHTIYPFLRSVPREMGSVRGDRGPARRLLRAISSVEQWVDSKYIVIETVFV